MRGRRLRSSRDIACVSRSLEQHAVGDAGEWIVQRSVREGELLGRVDTVDDDPVDARVLDEVDHDDLQRAPLVVAPDAQLARDAAAGRAAGFGELGEDLLDIVRVDEVGDRGDTGQLHGTSLRTSRAQRG